MTLALHRAQLWMDVVRSHLAESRCNFPGDEASRKPWTQQIQLEEGTARIGISDEECWSSDEDDHNYVAVTNHRDEIDI